jgi:dihydropteroate synthase
MSDLEIIHIKTISEAENELRKIGVDKGGYKFLIPKALSFAIKIKEVKSIPANILKQEMLAIGGDAAVNRGVITHKAEKSDILLIGNLEQYRKLIYKLKMQQFGLPDIADNIQEILKRSVL